MNRFRTLLGLMALATALVLVTADVQARVGGGSSGGSRGSRTFSAPPSTRTAPTAAPIQRTITQPSQPSSGIGQAAGARPGLLGGGLFGGGLLGGLAAGFIGAGLFGMLFGHGFMGGMGGFASLLGLILQIALIVVVARLVMAWWHRRSEPAFAGGVPSGAQNFQRSAFPGFGGNAPAGDPLTIDKSDYDAFEALLGKIQTAYSNEDLGALRSLATPEMLSYFSEDLAANASHGVVNRVSDVKLLQGDLSEAWREGSTDYATVAMRFSLVDRTVERASGKLVDGSDQPQEVTELWTFMRARGGQWLLSAIQQT